MKKILKILLSLFFDYFMVKEQYAHCIIVAKRQDNRWEHGDGFSLGYPYSVYYFKFIVLNPILKPKANIEPFVVQVSQKVFDGKKESMTVLIPYRIGRYTGDIKFPSFVSELDRSTSFPLESLGI